MIVRRLVDGLDERLDGTSFIKRNLRKVFPDHWSFMLGEIALYSFVMLILTGTFLSLFFVASPAETVYRGPYAPLQGSDVSLAYESVLRISFEVRAGLVMRQTHHWAALVFLASIMAHLLRVFFTGRVPQAARAQLDHRRRRCSCSASAPGSPATRSPTTCSRARACASSTRPCSRSRSIGTWLAYLFFGGEFPSAELIPRLLVMHILLIPPLIVGALSAPPRPRVAPDPHPVPRRGHPGGVGHRHPRVAEVRAEVGRAWRS